MRKKDQDLLAEAYYKILDENIVAAAKNQFRTLTNHDDQQFVDGVLGMGGGVLRDIQNANGNTQVIKKIVRDAIGTTAGAEGATTLNSHFVYDKLESDPNAINLMLKIIQDDPNAQKAIKSMDDKTDWMAQNFKSY